MNGLLNIESDEEGNLLYTYPNRVRLPRDGKIDPRREAAAKAASTALVPTGPASVVKATSTGTGAIARQHRSSGSFSPTRRRKSRSQCATAFDPVSGTAPRESPGGMTRCRFCNEVILVGAKKCKHCHEYLDDALREIQNLKQPGGMHHPPPQTALAPQPTPQPVQIQQWTNTNATQAALLSFVPGLGQMCSGRVPAGLFVDDVYVPRLRLFHRAGDRAAHSLRDQRGPSAAAGYSVTSVTRTPSSPSTSTSSPRAITRPRQSNQQVQPAVVRREPLRQAAIPGSRERSA